MTARGFQGTQRSAHKMPNSVSLLQRNQCDFCFSDANAGNWRIVLPNLYMLPACFTRLGIISACWGSSLRSWEQRAFVGDPTSGPGGQRHKPRRLEPPIGSHDAENRKRLDFTKILTTPRLPSGERVLLSYHSTNKIKSYINSE